MSWLDILRRACDRASQTHVCRRLRDASGSSFPSEAVVSQVLNGRYPGRTDRLESLVGGVYGGAVVTCPVLGEIGSDVCDRYQYAPYSGANPTRVVLYRACRSGCPNSRQEQAR